jgi:hypothetical protein
MHRIYWQQHYAQHANLDLQAMVSASVPRRVRPQPRPGAAFKPDRLTSWFQSYHMTLHRERALGAVAMQPRNGSYADIPTAAFVFGRSVSYLELQREVRANLPPGGGEASLPPPSRGSGKHASWLLCYMPIPVTELGCARFTQLSALGPGCSGSLQCLADAGLFPATTTATLGDEALHRPPFMSAPSRRAVRRAGSNAVAEPAHGDDSDPEDGEAAANQPAAPYSDRFAAAPCTLCGAAAASSIYHLITSCTHASMRDARTELADAVPDALRAIVRGCRSAMRDAIAAPRTAAPPAERLALAAIVMPHGAVPNNADGRMLTYRLLTGVPWPREPMARAGTFPAAAALGAVFDATAAPPSRLRHMASAWLAWSEKQLCHNLARRWRQALGLPPTLPRRW